MKGIQGLIVAIGLGLVGMIFNWMYLNSGPSHNASLSFIGIKQGQTINRGEVLRDEHLEDVKLPEPLVGNLGGYAVQYKDKSTVIGQPVWRTLTGQCLLLNEDIKTPPKELKLGPDESAMWIPVDTRAFVPSLFNPGDTVSFLIPQPAQTMPTPAVPGGALRPIADPATAAATTAAPQPIGPFTILALGNRLGSTEIMRAARQPQVQENVLAIRVSSHVNGELERAQKLWSLLQATNFRQVGVMLHSRKTETP